jgi:tRNA pseudouridine38-40 synthase
MRRFRLTIAYDGAGYSGWQIQSGRLTVQEALQAGLEAIVRHPCKVHGSGRTDQGVHAMGQVAHVDLETRMTPLMLRRALNARLPDDIRMVGGRVVNGRFHARRSAVAKEYRYFIWNDEWMPPHKRLYALHVRRTLDVGAMQTGAAGFIGKHDFAAFMANPNRTVDSRVRTVTRCVIRRCGRRIEIRVRGNGFLYKQVRSMVGLLLRIGQGAERPELVAQLLTEQAPRTARVPSAPPQGLFLWRVWY